MTSSQAVVSIDPESEQLVRDLADARAKVENLEQALTTARVIGAAVGIVMATSKLTYDAAFEALVTYSQQRNCKLRHVADRVVLTGEL